VNRRGQVYVVDPSAAQGREQAGRRPVLVVSADLNHRQPLVVAVVVGTDARNVPRDYPGSRQRRAGRSTPCSCASSSDRSIPLASWISEAVRSGGWDLPDRKVAVKGVRGDERC
jgi:mRNA-degrading endonuclease toxin of MazEF toxin-antitoxin module